MIYFEGGQQCRSNLECGGKARPRRRLGFVGAAKRFRAAGDPKRRRRIRSAAAV